MCNSYRLSLVTTPFRTERRGHEATILSTELVLLLLCIVEQRFTLCSEVNGAFSLSSKVPWPTAFLRMHSEALSQQWSPWLAHFCLVEVGTGYTQATFHVVH